MTQGVTKPPEDVLETYDSEDIPRLGKSGPNAQKEQFSGGDGESEIEVAVGDLVIKSPTFSDGRKCYIVLNIFDHSLIMWDLREGQYKDYPIDFLTEDLSIDDYDITAYDDPWNLR